MAKGKRKKQKKSGTARKAPAKPRTVKKRRSTSREEPEDAAPAAAERRAGTTSGDEEQVPMLYVGIAAVVIGVAGVFAYTQFFSGDTASGDESAETADTAEGESGTDLRIEAPSDVAEPPEDAERTDSGLASRVLRQGSGDVHPGPTTRVRVHYSGWTTDGERFDSSVERGEPTEFGLNGVIAGWTEGLQLMVVGEQRRFWIPEELAYQGRPGRPAGMLVFDVELIAILD